MITVNVMYDLVSGHIQAASLYAITPPGGFGIVQLTLNNFTDIFNKRIDPVAQTLLNKNFLQVDNNPNIPINSVIQLAFSKHDGTTKALMNTSQDNDAVQISARQPDFSFNSAFRRAFFDVEQTALVNGAGSVKMAAGGAPGQEMIVVFNDILQPAFQTFNYTT